MTEITRERISGRGGRLAILRAWWGERPIVQIGLFLALGVVLAGLGSNALASMQRLGISPGFAFLGRAASFEIGETLIPYAAGDTYGRALLAGLLNTIEVAVLGCALATTLGLALGIARLSGNLLLSGLVQAYVEVMRNTPLLLQLFFWSATLHALPAPRQALSLFDLGLLSNRGVFLPALTIAGPSSGLILGLGAVIGVAVLIAQKARGHALRPLRAILVMATACALAFIVAMAAGASFAFSMPRLQGFNIKGGVALSPEFAALLIGLTVNSAATISEIVRSGIESVPKGQWEAARSLGLPPTRVFRLVILPQAMRIITPLLTSSYLDLTKNSSLAVAIGFPDLVSVVNTSANQTGQAIETISVLVLAYLALNLTVSAAMNRRNARVMRMVAVR